MEAVNYPQMNIVVRRRISGGRAVNSECTMSVLTKRDTAEAVRMYESEVGALTPDLFARITPQQIGETIEKDGIMVGVRFKNRLVCLRSVITEEPALRTALCKCCLPPDEHSRSTMTGFCVVDRKFRGNNIQFLSYYYIENIVSRRFDSIITTVAPKNIFSLENILAYGFSITGLKYMYEGHLRYVMKKYFRPSSVLWTRGHRQIALDDLETQNKALAEGLSGYKLLWDEEHGFRLLFGKMELTKQ